MGMKAVPKGSFTRSVNVTIFVSGTFDINHVMCKQYHSNRLNQNGYLYGTVSVNEL